MTAILWTLKSFKTDPHFDMIFFLLGQRLWESCCFYSLRGFKELKIPEIHYKWSNRLDVDSGAN